MTWDEKIPQKYVFYEETIGEHTILWRRHILSHRIHGAGIYANMTGVYWWDPCYHIYSIHTWIRHGFLSWWLHFARTKESDHLIRLQGNVCSSQLGPYNLRHPVPTSSLGLEAAAAPLDSTRRRHIQPYGGFVKCGILNTIDFNTSLISCWITWGTPMTWYLHIFFRKRNMRIHAWI